MIKERQQKWLEYLKSGRFPKGKNALQMDGEFCCLGVACEILVEEGVMLHGQNGYIYNGREDALVMPGGSHELFGLTSSAGTRNDMPSINVNDVNSALSKLNDSCDDFDTVIKAIETGAYYANA